MSWGVAWESMHYHAERGNEQIEMSMGQTIGYRGANLRRDGVYQTLDP